MVLFRMKPEFLGLGLAVLAGPLAAIEAQRPPAQGPWLVVVPPWRAIEAVLAAADARPVGATVAPLGILADAEGADVPQRLHAAGAWIVLGADGLAWFCGDVRASPQSE